MVCAVRIYCMICILCLGVCGCLCVLWLETGSLLYAGLSVFMRQGVAFGCKWCWGDMNSTRERVLFVSFISFLLSFRCLIAPGLMKVGNPCKSSVTWPSWPPHLLYPVFQSLLSLTYFKSESRNAHMVPTVEPSDNSILSDGALF